jgi:GAF domain-containing protein
VESALFMATIPAIIRPKLDSKPDQSSTRLNGWQKYAAWVTFGLIFVATWASFAHNSLGSNHFREGMSGFNWNMAVLYTDGLDWLLMIAATVAAGLLVWRKAKDKIALFSAIMILTFSAANTTAMNITLMQNDCWQQLTAGVIAIGFGSLLVFLYIFPDGHFVPSWTKYISLAFIGWCLTWPFMPDVSALSGHIPTWFIFCVLTPAYLSGIWSQGYRRMHVSLVEHQQSKWTLFGLMLALIGFFVNSFFNYMVARVPYEAGGNVAPVLLLVLPLITTLAIAAIPITVSMSVLRVRLWELDPLIHRTVIYTVATVALGVFFVAEIAVFQAIFVAVIGQKSDVAIVASTLIIAALFQPTRKMARQMIDRRFYREKIDFEKAFTELSREIRTIIDLSHLSRYILEQVSTLLHVSYSAVFLPQPDGTFKIEETFNPENVPEIICSLDRQIINTRPGDGVMLPPDFLSKLQTGHSISHPKDMPFWLCVPLLTPRMGGTELVGFLGFGPRRSGQDYSREDQMLLRNLADQAGTAMYVAHLLEQQQEETARREQAERALDAHRHSPLGQAEEFAETLIAKPATALTELHKLTQKAGDDPATAALLSNLYRVLDTPVTEPISQLAGGYMFMYKALWDPELLPLGLRTLIKQLEQPPTSSWAGAREALILYRLSQVALNAQTATQITELLPGMQEGIAECDAEVLGGIQTNAAQPNFVMLDTDGPMANQSPDGQPLILPDFLFGLKSALDELQGVAETLYAFERVDTSSDKLAFLVSTVERLSRIDRSARTDLASADRAIVLRIAEKWLAIVSGMMSEIQTRAQITCRLLTHHTWQDDVISLSLNVRNDGRSAALKIRVNLAPSPDYTLIEPATAIERLAPDEETQVELRIRPRLAADIDQFRARFIVQYADPRGSDQVDNFADVVYLLKTGGEFKFIPNPYVIGTPLQTGSPLFIGREDVVGFIQENLAATHRNNLVLIGQRRTGKTSLLKQLPARLGADYLPVYLDGQSLSLDPGMANFFLNLATEITFAMEDYGLIPPEMPDFTDSPAATFERGFLLPARKIIGERHLLLLFDEFEELETAVRRGNLEPSVFGFLRHMIQHGERISVIFCGTHRMEELASDYWNVLFNISLYRHVGFLEKEEAQRLIQEPVAELGMRYDDLALDKIWRITAGHPYFLQLLCHSLVNRHNKTKRSYMTIADVNAALDDIIASGEAHFIYLWTQATPEERLVLAAISRSMPLTGRTTVVQVQDFLEERGIHMDRAAIDTALHKLVLTDVLTNNGLSDTTVGETYRWRLGLLGLWVEKYKSITRVADEFRSTVAVQA